MKEVKVYKYDKKPGDTFMPKGEYIVSLYGGTQFLAQWAGDPGRTCIRDSAKRYKSEFAAHCALGYAKRNFPNRDYSEAKVVKA